MISKRRHPKQKFDILNSTFSIKNVFFAGTFEALLKTNGSQNKYLNNPKIYVIKIFAHIYIVSYGWPNGWTQWADIF